MSFSSPKSYRLPERSQLIADLTAGLTFAVVNVPQAMGNAVLALVNPVYGLYTLMLATPIGALFTSSVYMNVSTTGALSVAAGDALYFFPEERRTVALVTLVLLIGLVQLTAGLLKLGSLIRFVSQSVMTGFITGIAINIVLGALPDLTGYTSPFYSNILALADTILSWSQFDPATFILGLLTIGLIIGFGYTPLRKFSMIVALVLATLVSILLTAGLGIDSLERVGDIAKIPGSLPRPILPDITLIPSLFLPAVAIAIIGLVQGAGVGQSYPNPDGKYPDVSRDFTGQGLANVAASFFQGVPAGGSMSGTAVSVNAGAQSRWANIFAGVLVAAIVLMLVDIVNLVPMAGLAGLLVVVGLQNIRPESIRVVWRTGAVPRTVMVITFLSTLVMPLQYAILAGVAISILLHTAQASNRVEVVEIKLTEGGLPLERPAPANLPSNEITLLYAYGSLFFATASTFEKQLPAVVDAENPVVILMLRGQKDVGSTLNRVLLTYAKTLQNNGGKLVITGICQRLRDQLDRTGVTAELGEENLYIEQAQIGAATNDAVKQARQWLAQKT